MAGAFFKITLLMISENLFQCRDPKFSRKEASMLAGAVKLSNIRCSCSKFTPSAAMFSRKKSAQRVNDIISYQANNCDSTQFKHTEDTRRIEKVFGSTSKCLLTG